MVVRGTERYLFESFRLAVYVGNNTTQSSQGKRDESCQITRLLDRASLNHM